MTTLTLALQAVQKDGIVLRRRHPKDVRSRVIRLTPKVTGKLEALGRCAAYHDSRVDAIVGAAKPSRAVASALRTSMPGRFLRGQPAYLFMAFLLVSTDLPVDWESLAALELE
jgi:hypothetical protein